MNTVIYKKTTNILEDLQKCKLVSENFKNISIEKRNKIIKDIGDTIIKNNDIIILENLKDLEGMDINDPMYDRLLLNEKRIKGIADGCYDLVNISNPLLKYDTEKEISTSKGLIIKKIGIPIGVVSCIYESRPNVTIDIAIMCIKSSNGVILRGGSQAKYSNRVLIKLIREVLIKNDINPDLIYNFPLERDKLDVLYNAIGLVDVIIPRGGKKLIDSVRDNSKIPVIETGAGVVHLYLDNDINNKNIDKAIDVIVNAKTNRISVCNALDTLIINRNTDNEILKNLFNKLSTAGVKFGIQKSQLEHINSFEFEYFIIESNEFYKEQLSLNLHIIFVNNIDESIKHILKYSSKHSDGILSDNNDKIDFFNNNIDSSVVYTNTSTRFSDGSCFGFGGEIGISTQKLHARGPMGSESLVTYKYSIVSDWIIRN